jgi:polyisoprenoid-binding protein YceI
MRILICALFLLLLQPQYNIKPTTINWKSGMFSGTVKLSDGNLSFKDNLLVDGEFVLDANSIEANYLVEPLIYSDELLDIENNPKIYIEFDKCTKVSDDVYLIYANLSLKGNSKPVIFYLYTINRVAKCEILVKCSDYDSTYKRKFKLYINAKYQ